MELDVNHKSIQNVTEERALDSMPESQFRSSLAHPSRRLLELLEKPIVKSLITGDPAFAPIEDLVVEALEKLIASNQEKSEQIAKLVYLQLNATSPAIPNQNQHTFGDNSNLHLGSDLHSPNQMPRFYSQQNGNGEKVSVGVDTDLADHHHGLKLSLVDKPPSLKKNISKSQIITPDFKHLNSLGMFLDHLAERIQQKESTDYRKSMNSERNISNAEEERLLRLRNPKLVLRSPSGTYEDEMHFKVLQQGLTQDGGLFQTQVFEDEDENSLEEKEPIFPVVIDECKPGSKSEIPIALSQFADNSKNEQSDNVSNYCCPPQRYNDFNVSCISNSAVSKSMVSKFEPNLTNNLTQALKKSGTESGDSSEDLLERIDRQLHESNQKWLPDKEGDQARITLGKNDHALINEAAEELETITGSFKEGSFKPIPNEFKNDLLDEVDKAIVQWNKKTSTRDAELTLQVIEEGEADSKSGELSHRSSSQNNPFRQEVSPGQNSGNPSKEPSRKTLNFQERSRESLHESLKAAKKLNKDIPLPERETLRSMVRAPSGRNTNNINSSTDANRIQDSQKRPDHSPDCMAYREIKWQNHQLSLSNASSQYQTNQSIRMEAPPSISHFYSNTIRTVSRSIEKVYSPSYKVIIEPSGIKHDFGVIQSVTPQHKTEALSNFNTGKPQLYLAPPPPLYISKLLRESNFSRGENQPSHSREVYLVRMEGEKSVYRYKEDLNK